MADLTDLPLNQRAALFEAPPKAAAPVLRKGIGSSKGLTIVRPLPAAGSSAPPPKDSSPQKEPPQQQPAPPPPQAQAQEAQPQDDLSAQAVSCGRAGVGSMGKTPPAARYGAATSASRPPWRL